MPRPAWQIADRFGRRDWPRRQLTFPDPLCTVSGMPDESDAPAKIKALGSYWESLAGGAVPERSALDIAKIVPLLPYVMLMEVDPAPFIVRYRLTGTKIDDWVGLNVTGRTLNEFVPGDRTGSSAYLMACYEKSWRTAQPVIGAYDWPSVGGNPLRIWFGIFPLKLDGELRQFLVVEDFAAVPDDAEPLPWLDPFADET
jgi:hypothetical protein